MTENTVRAIVENFFANYSKRSKNILTGSEITPQLLSRHTARYGMSLAPNEQPILVVNHLQCFGVIELLEKIPYLGKFIELMNWQKTGIVLTDTNVYFGTLKLSPFTSLTMLKGPSGCRKLNDIKSIGIGDHDACVGTAYVGHIFQINDEALGYIRMGGKIEFDGDELELLNAFFPYFVAKLKEMEKIQEVK